MTHRWRVVPLAVISVLSAASGALAAPITPQQVLDSARIHYPMILRAADQIRAAEGARQEAEGAFDATAESQLYSRPNGFYDGNQADARIVKPMPFANSRIYGGYRLSDGSFPIYEDERITNNGGEYLIGGGLSLLRDRMIDARRLSLANTTLERDIAEIDQTLTKLSVQRDALQHYWRWVAARAVRDVRRDLLDIAQERQNGISRSVRSGNVASIFLTENKQYILQRESELNEAERILNIRANALSLFLRDDKGSPLPLKAGDEGMAFPVAENVPAVETVMEKITARPELARLKRERDVQENNRAMGENMLLPRADLGVEFSDDRGGGDFRRDEGEAIVKLDISIPLQRNLGEGRRARAEASMRALDHARRLAEDSLKAELENTVKNLEIYREFIKLTRDEITLAQRMQAAERIRFENGDSDFFVLNLREQKTAEARIRNAVAQEAFQSELAALHALTMNEKALALNSKN